MPEPTPEELARLTMSEIPDSDPLGLFEAWFEEAKASEPNDPNAMALATATPEGAQTCWAHMCPRTDRMHTVVYGARRLCMNEGLK